MNNNSEGPKKDYEDQNKSEDKEDNQEAQRPDQFTLIKIALLKLNWVGPKDWRIASRHANRLMVMGQVLAKDPAASKSKPQSIQPSNKALTTLKEQARRLVGTLEELDRYAYKALLIADQEWHREETKKQIRAEARRLSEKRQDFDEDHYYEMLVSSFEDRATAAAEGSMAVARLITELKRLPEISLKAKDHLPASFEEAEGHDGKPEPALIRDEVARIFQELTGDDPSRSYARKETGEEDGDKQISNSPFTICLAQVFAALEIEASADYHTKRWKKINRE